MKKILYTGMMLSFLAFAGKVNAQNFYTELNVGYGWGLGNTVLGVSEYRDYSGTDSEVSSIYGTLGGGLNLAITPGYMFNEHIGVELGINYFMGSKVVMNELTTSLEGRYDKTTAYSNQLRILPAVVVSTGSSTIYGYAKAGLVLPVYGSTVGIKEESNINPVYGPIVEEAHTVTNGSLSLGFRGALGIGYNVTDNLAVSLEVAYTSLTIKAKKRVLDSYLAAGEEKIDNFPVYATDIEYVDKLTSESNNSDVNPNFNGDLPKEELATKTSFSQLGVSLGIKYSF